MPGADENDPSAAWNMVSLDTAEESEAEAESVTGDAVEEDAPKLKPFEENNPSGEPMDA